MYRLRELERKDLDKINRWRNDPELIALLGAPFRYINLEVDVKWFENYMSNRGNAIRCAIVDEEEEDKILGLVSLVSIDFMNQSAELHIMIGDKENQGKGVGTFAVREMLHHAFFNMNLQRVELSVLDDNARAQHLYEKCGFVFEGKKRCAKYKNGRFVDLKQYAILRNEYLVEKLGGVRQTDLPDYCIAQVEEYSRRRAALYCCDQAFPIPIERRENYGLLINKICTSAEFVIAYSSKMMGYAAMYANDSVNHEAYLTLIAVHPSFQRKRIGYYLVKNCIDIAASRGMQAIRLEVKKDNYAAIELYRKCGFGICPVQGKDSMYMTRKILEAG